LGSDWRATVTGLPGHRAVEWLRALSESIQIADVPKEKADLMHAIYERITVAGPEIVGVRLTAAAYAHGLALALPEKVVMARPTGVGRAITTYRVPIEGRDEWLAAARRQA
jgi:malate/lactate dehydrogenase